MQLLSCCVSEELEVFGFRGTITSSKPYFSPKTWKEGYTYSLSGFWGVEKYGGSEWSEGSGGGDLGAGKLAWNSQNRPGSQHSTRNLWGHTVPCNDLSSPPRENQCFYSRYCNVLRTWNFSILASTYLLLHSLQFCALTFSVLSECATAELISGVLSQHHGQIFPSLQECVEEFSAKILVQVLALIWAHEKSVSE